MMTYKEQEKAFKNLEKYQWKPKFINQNTINPNLKLKQKKNQSLLNTNKIIVKNKRKINYIKKY